MWREMKEEVELELAMLREHVSSLAELRERTRQAQPDRVEMLALGAFLHGLYGGMENALKRIVVHMDGDLPRSTQWHRDLLNRAASNYGSRPAAISPDLREKLKAYLDFRHFFRQAYAHQLRWEKMASLVQDSPGILDALDTELMAFLKTTGPDE